MKILSTIIFGCSLLCSGLALAQQQTKSCTCKDCKCTSQSHCGCHSKQGCACGENSSCCSGRDCGGHLLSFDGASFHHGNPNEHEDIETI